MKDFAIIKYARPIMAYLIILLSFGVVYMIVLREVKPGSGQAVYIAVGAVLTTLGSVVSYYFGASKDKSDQEQASTRNDSHIVELKKQIAESTAKMQGLIDGGTPVDDVQCTVIREKLEQLQKLLNLLQAKT